jgi:hypothetical protein
MPVTWMWDPTSNLAMLHVTVPYTFAQWRTAFDAILKRATAGPVHFLVDRRDAGIPATPMAQEMLTYFRQHAPRLAGARVAIVVNVESKYGIDRMATICDSVRKLGVKIEVFSNPPEAFRWLGEPA